MMKFVKKLILLLVAALVAVQFVPVKRENPPVEADIAASSEVKAVLRRACYDCHSNETEWPWYSRVAPVSWLVSRDVTKGREELNFSTFGNLPPEKRKKKIHEAWEEVEEGKMPLAIYTRLHGDAKLSDPDRAVLRAWAAAEGR